MDVSVVIESILALFIMILVGVYARRRQIITDEVNNGLVNILIHIALPFMIISSFFNGYDNTIKANLFKTTLLSLAAYGLMASVSYLLLKPVKRDKNTILHFANVFVNTGYVGFPILNSVYGAEGVMYGSIFNIFFVVLLWTYGIVLFKGGLKAKEFKQELKQALLNPSILAVFAGIMIMSFNIQLPSVFISASRSIGQLTGPLSMMIIGGILSKVNIKTYVTDWTVYYGITVKLIIIPVIIYLAALAIGPSIPVNSVVIMTAMPASAMTSILAENFNKEKEFAAFIVSATTLLSLVTVLLLINFMML